MIKTSRQIVVTILSGATIEELIEELQNFPLNAFFTRIKGSCLVFEEEED